jgi:zinc-binding alcohol dehydrogenase/oxidoreductase
VAVASRSQVKAERCRPLGADAALSFGEDRPLDRVLWEWSDKKGVDVIFDSVGAPTIGRSIQALARGGRVVVIGATGGSTAQVNLATLFWRQCSIRGSTMSNESEFQKVLEHLGAGHLRAVVDSVFPFSRAVEAFRHFDGPDLFGKVVLDVTAG